MECRQGNLVAQRRSKKELKNYRPIALAETCSKIFCAVLNEQKQKCMERGSVLGEEQNGFRWDRGADDNIFVVNELIERMKRGGKRVHLAFIGIKKVYGSDRKLLYQLLKKIGMSEKYVRIVNSMYVTLEQNIGVKMQRQAG
jgi:hypothetical protein